MESNQSAGAGAEIKLVDVGQWLDEHFKRKDGKPLSDRTKRHYIKKFKLRKVIVRVGWANKINPQDGVRQLLTFAGGEQPQRPRRGRPRKYSNGM